MTPRLWRVSERTETQREDRANSEEQPPPSSNAIVSETLSLTVGPVFGGFQSVMVVTIALIMLWVPGSRFGSLTIDGPYL